MTSTPEDTILDNAEGFLSKLLSQDKSAVVVAAVLTPVMKGLQTRLDAFPASLVHLGQACLGAVLMQALTDTDEDEKLELQWQSSGPFGNLYADCLGTGKIRGTIQNPRAEVSSFTVPIGDGLLQVRRSDKTQVNVTGIVSSKGWVSEDLRDFLHQSEQKTCLIDLHVGLGIEKDQDSIEKLGVVDAFGVMIHILPTDTEEEKQRLLDTWSHRLSMLGPLSEWALPRDPKRAAHSMIEWITVGSKPSLLREYPLRYHCSCSVDRIQRAIGLLTTREKKWILSEKESDLSKDDIQVNCEFCGKTYNIKKANV